MSIVPGPIGRVDNPDATGNARGHGPPLSTRLHDGPKGSEGHAPSTYAPVTMPARSLAARTAHGPARRMGNAGVLSGNLEQHGHPFVQRIHLAGGLSYLWPRPATPQVFATPNEDGNAATITTTPYAHPGGQTHAASHFLIRTTGGATAYDSGAIRATEEHPTPVLPPGTYVAYARHRDALNQWSAWGESAPFALTGTRTIDYEDKAAPRGVRAAWFEVWSDLAVAGGTRLAFIPHALEASTLEELNGREQLRLVVPRTLAASPHGAAKQPADAGPWEEIAERRVIRAVFSDLTWAEWRILRTDGERAENGALAGAIEAESPTYDLNRGLIAREEADGQVAHAFGLYGLTVAEHAAAILESAPHYFALGLVESDKVLDVEYQEQTPLAALRHLAQETETELLVERSEGGRYAVSLRTEIGAERERARLALGRNLRQNKRSGDATEQANRIYPFGALEDSTRASIAEAAWEVIAIDATLNRLMLAGGPIGFERALNDLWLELLGTTTRARILDTFHATQEVEVHPGDLPRFAEGSVVVVRRDAQGGRLTYLDHPQSIAAHGGLAHGIYPAALVRDDIPAIDNLVANAFLEHWHQGRPERWWSVGGAPITRNVEKLYKSHGTASAHVDARTAEEGIESDWFLITPTAERPYACAQFALFPTGGKVRAELLLSDGAAMVKLPASGWVLTSRMNEWVQDLAIGGIDIHDHAALGLDGPVSMAKLRLVAHEGPATFYLDAAQFTQSASGAEQFYAGRASNDLWHAGIRALKERAFAKETYDVAAFDLYRADPEQYRHDALELGATALLADPALGAHHRALRITAVARDLLVPLQTQVRLAVPAPDLTEIIARRESAPRRTGDLPPPRNRPDAPKREGAASSALTLTFAASRVEEQVIVEESKTATFAAALADAGAGTREGRDKSGAASSALTLAFTAIRTEEQIITGEEKIAAFAAQLADSGAGTRQNR
jgi:hypothetical protein